MKSRSFKIVRSRVCQSEESVELQTKALDLLIKKLLLAAQGMMPWQKKSRFFCCSGITSIFF